MHSIIKTLSFVAVLVIIMQACSQKPDSDRRTNTDLLGADNTVLMPISESKMIEIAIEAGTNADGKPAAQSRDVSAQFVIHNLSTEGSTVDMQIKDGEVVKFEMTSYISIGKYLAVFDPETKIITSTAKYFEHTKLKDETSKLKFVHFSVEKVKLRPAQSRYMIETECVYRSILHHAVLNTQPYPDLYLDCDVN